MYLFPSALIIKVVALVPYAAKMGCQVPHILLLTNAILALRTESLREAERHVGIDVVRRYGMKAFSLAETEATEARRQ
jgi:hypothetical protein